MASVTLAIPHPDIPLMYQRIQVIDARHIVNLIHEEAVAQI